MATIAEKWEERGLQRGIQQGMQQGLEQGEKQVLIRLVRHRFGESVVRQSEELLKSIANSEQLEALSETLLDCHDGEQWLQQLQALISHNQN